MSPSLRAPRAPDNVPPEGRSYTLPQMKMRVVALVHEREGGRAVIELSECLAAWGFADQNTIENLCICAAICEAHEFICAAICGAHRFICAAICGAHRFICAAICGAHRFICAAICGAHEFIRAAICEAHGFIREVLSLP